MVHGVGDLGDGIDEPDTGGEARSLDAAAQASCVARPVLELGECASHIDRTQLFHESTVARRPARSQGKIVADCAAVETLQVVVGAAIVDGERVLAAQRSDPPSLAGFWEFPGGKVDAGETDEAALIRECHEELAIDIMLGARVGRDWPIGEHGVLRVWLAAVAAGEPTAIEHAALRWLTVDELHDVAWVPADLPIVDRLAAMMSNR